ncbi:hypothetical protein JCM8097_002728 [Rhodosporidiobolus ruineniae]
MAPSSKDPSVEAVDETYVLESRDGDREAQPAVVDDRALLRKIDRWFVPPLAILYLMSFLDRSNLGKCVVFGLKEDLNLMGNEYNVALAVFYALYVIVEAPANAILERWRAGAWISLIMFLTAIITICMGFVRNYGSLMAVRALLGIVEGGFYPGAMAMIQAWYPRAETAYRSCLLYAAANASGAFGGLIARGIERMDGIAGREGWRWIFIIEGAITVVVVGGCSFILPDSPRTARFLTEVEKDRVVARTQEDDQSMPQDFDKRYIIDAITSPIVWTFMLVELGSLTSVYAFSNFAPSIIKGMGFTAANANLLTVPPYVLGCIVCFIVGHLSDRYKTRYPFVITLALVAFAGYIILIATDVVAAQYVACCLVCMGSFALIPLEISWNGNCQGGSLKRAVGIAMQIGCANTGGIVGAFVYRTEDAPRYILGHAVMAGFLGMTMILSTGIYLYLRRENARRDAKYGPGPECYANLSRNIINEERVWGDNARWFRYML